MKAETSFRNIQHSRAVDGSNMTELAEGFPRTQSTFELYGHRHASNRLIERSLHGKSLTYTSAHCS